MTLRERLLWAAGFPSAARVRQAGDPERPIPRISAIVCTRNRPADVTRAVRSILRSDYPDDFEVIVVDQSDNEQAAVALRAFDGDPRLRYLRSLTKGAALARNEGAVASRSEILAYTDDDCTVPADWLRRVEAAFRARPDVGVVFGDVVAARHDRRRGTIPAFRHRRSRVIRSMRAYSSSIGMGASLSVRRRALDAVGRFDATLGPGGEIPSAEDHDLALRLLARGWAVLQTPRISVVHHGFRTYDEFRALTRRDWTAIGAVHAKLLLAGELGVAPVAAYNIFVRALAEPLSALLRFERPRGLRRQLFYWKGVATALQRRTDRRTLRFVRPRPRLAQASR